MRRARQKRRRGDAQREEKTRETFGFFSFFSIKNIMPASFTRCQNRGGQFYTKKLGGGMYRVYCVDPVTHAHLAGHIKKRKSKKKRSSRKRR